MRQSSDLNQPSSQDQLEGQLAQVDSISIPSDYYGDALSNFQNEIENVVYAVYPELIGKGETPEEHYQLQNQALSDFFNDPIHIEVNAPNQIRQFQQPTKKISQGVLFAVMMVLYGVFGGAATIPPKFSKPNNSVPVSTPKKKKCVTVENTPKPLSAEYISNCLSKIEQLAHQALTAQGFKLQSSGIREFIKLFNQYSDLSYTQGLDIEPCSNSQCFAAIKSNSPHWKSFITKAPKKFHDLLLNTPKSIILLPKVFHSKMNQVDGTIEENRTIIIARQSHIPMIATAIHESQHLANESKKLTLLADELSAYSIELDYYQTLALELKEKNQFNPEIERKIITIKELLKNGNYLQKRGLTEIYPETRTTAGMLVKYLDQSTIQNLAQSNSSIDQQRDQNLKIAAEIALYFYQTNDPFELKKILTEKYLNNRRATKIQRHQAISLINHALPFLAPQPDDSRADFSPQKIKSKRQLSRIRRRHKSTLHNPEINKSYTGLHGPPNHNSRATIDNLSEVTRQLLRQRPDYLKKNPHILDKDKLDRWSRRMQHRINLPEIQPIPNNIFQHYHQFPADLKQSTTEVLNHGFPSKRIDVIDSAGQQLTISQDVRTTIKEQIAKLPDSIPQVYLCPYEDKTGGKAKFRRDFSPANSSSNQQNNSQVSINLPTAGAFNGDIKLAQLTQNLILLFSQGQGFFESQNNEGYAKSHAWSLELLNQSKVQANPFLLLSAQKLYSINAFVLSPQSAIEKIRELFAPASFQSNPQQPPIRFFSDHPNQVFYSQQNQAEKYIVGIEALLDITSQVSKSKHFSQGRKIYTQLTALAIIDDLRRALGITDNEVMTKYLKPEPKAKNNQNGKITINISVPPPGPPTDISSWKECQSRIQSLIYQEQDRSPQLLGNLKLTQEPTHSQNIDYLRELIFISMGQICQQLEHTTRSSDQIKTAIYIPEQFTKRSDFPLLRPVAPTTEATAK